MVNRNHSTNGAYRRRGHIKTALGIGLRTRLISVSPRYIFAWNMYRHRVFLGSLATVIRVLKPE